VEPLLVGHIADYHPAVISGTHSSWARFGGYLNRASDLPPGNTVSWRGLSRLTDIEVGYLLGANLSERARRHSNGKSVS
jgi:hypothetical protein